MTMTTRETFRVLRRHRPQSPAWAVLAVARAVVAGLSPAPRVIEQGVGAAFSVGRDSLRFIENPAALGLRRVGFADEIGRGRHGLRPGVVDHRGWFLDDLHQGEVARGVVFQCSARKGRPRFLSAIADPYADARATHGAAMVRLVVLEGERSDSGYDFQEAAAQAAREADSMAQVYAEAERDYQRAWRAGQEYAEHKAEAVAARREFLSVRREAREAAAQVAPRPALCAALKRHLESLVDSFREARDAMADLASGGDGKGGSYHWSPSDKAQAAAFAEGRNS